MDAIVRLRCPFCHDALDAERVLCRTCLAPHHADCFAEHGRCATHGCVETRAEELQPRREARSAAGDVAGPRLAVGGAGGVAAVLVSAASPWPAAWRRDVKSAATPLAAFVGCALAFALLGRATAGLRGGLAPVFVLLIAGVVGLVVGCAVGVGFVEHRH